jgi:hypothetical protein
MDKHEAVDVYLMALIDMCDKCEIKDGPDRSVFLEPGCKVNQRARAIGKEIHRLGGMDAMVYVCTMVNALGVPGDSRELEFCWHGIGEWRA